MTAYTPARATATPLPAPANTSPFVAMSPGQRLLVIGGFWLATLSVTGLALYNQTSGAMAVIPALVLLVALNLVPLVWYRAEYGWFHPLIFGALMFFVELMRGFSAYARGLPLHVALPDYDQARLAGLVAYELLLGALGLLAYYAGFFLAPRPGVPQLHFAPPRHLRLKALAVIALASAVFLVFLSRRGGLESHILSWGGSRHASVGGEHYWIQIARWSLYAGLIWLALERRAVRRPLFWASVVAGLSIAFLTTGSRSAVLAPIAMGMMIWMIRERRIAVSKILLFALLALMVINVLGSFRRSTWEGRVGWEHLTNIQLTEALSAEEIVSRSTIGSGTLPILERVPDEVGLLYGETYLAVLTMPVPRWLWPDKPGLVGGRVGQIFFNQTGGVPPGVIGEAYWNFHIAGVLIVFLLLGIFHQWLAALLCRYGREPAAILLYVLILYTFSPTSSGLIGWLVMLAPVLLMLRLFGAITLRRRHVSA